MDVETTRDHPMQAKLKCLGLSCAGKCCIRSKEPRNITIPFYRDMTSRYWTREDEDKVMELLREILGTTGVDSGSSVNH